MSFWSKPAGGNGDAGALDHLHLNLTKTMWSSQIDCLQGGLSKQKQDQGAREEVDGLFGRVSGCELFL